jgi:transporter family protein
MIMSWKLFALGSAFFAGLTAIFGKLGVEGINSNLATFIRTVVILVMTFAIVSFQGEWRFPQRTMEMRPVVFLVLSAIATGLSWLFYYRALQMAPASMVAPVDKLSVVFAIVLSVLFLGEAVTPKLIVGGTLVVAGTLVLIWPY